jgi:hypothetical protein
MSGPFSRSGICDICEQPIVGVGGGHQGTCTACWDRFYSPEYQEAMRRGYEQWQAEREAKSKDALRTGTQAGKVDE